jgi:predicted nucleic acid-binding protein
MIVFLDSVIVIYLIEGPDAFRIQAKDRLAQLSAANDQPATSQLTRLECRIKPLRTNDALLLADYDAFFSSQSLRVFSLSDAVFERATLIRAQHGFRLGDSLNLAAALENGCARFLTNDFELKRFPDITVEVLT